MKSVIAYVVLAITVALTGGCGGGGGGSSSAVGSPTVSTGTFLDSPVAGINYRTETQSGQTDANGHFSYFPGEHVTFSVGAVMLPTVAADTTITPLHLANTTDLNNQVAINIAVFLQSLNQSGDPTNGISIAAQAHTAATTQIDFNVSSSAFSSNAALLALLNTSGSVNISLVSESSAKLHLQTMLNGGSGTTRINMAPVAEAGNAQSIAVGSTVTLSGAESRDANGDSITYAWTFASTPTGSSATLANATSVSPTFMPDVAGSYVVSLTVSDGSLSSVADTVTITAAIANTPPIANAGTAQSVVTGSTVTLSGSGSSDANGDAITYAWSFVSKPSSSSAALTNATSISPTFIPDVAGSYVVGLTVNDARVSSPLVTVTITAAVGNASAPTASGTSSSPYLESALVAAGNTNPNGFVQSSSGRVFDLRWGAFGAPITLSSSDNVSLTISSLGNATAQITPLSGAPTIYSVPNNFTSTSLTNVSSLGSQNNWITNFVLAAWASGLNGTGIGIAVLDDFTVSDRSEYQSIPLPTSCLNTTVNGSALYYCPSSAGIVYTMTHGQQVSSIISGLANSGRYLIYSTGPYAAQTATTTALGTLSIAQSISGYVSTPIFGVAFGANPTTARDDFLSHQTNGLFNQMKIWSSGTDSISTTFQRSKVVNLSLGGTSANPITIHSVLNNGA